MEFKESFFKGEEIEGFFVEEMMKRAWAAQLEVLKEIEKVCKNHNINYYADWGTLLGAIRHKGFIPWDDDVDICMKREDYQVLLTYAEQELPEGYVVLTPYNNSKYDPFTRILNSHAINTKEEFLERYHGFPYAAGIDIFPLDYIPRDRDEELLQRELIRIAIAAKSLHRNNQDVSDLIVKIEGLCNTKFNAKQPLLQQLNILIDQLSAMYTSEECDDIAPMHHYAAYGDCRLKKEWYGDPLWLPFENTVIAVPTDSEKVVRVEFGENYMTPVREVSHDYPFYRKQEKILEKHLREQGLSGSLTDLLNKSE